MLAGCDSTSEEEPVDSTPDASDSTVEPTPDSTSNDDSTSVDEHVHSYEEGAYEYSEDGHWQVCVDEDATTEVTSHDYDNGTYEDVENSEYHNVLCSVCGYVDELGEAHEFYANGTQGSYVNAEDGVYHYDYCLKCEYKLYEEHQYPASGVSGFFGTHGETCYQCRYSWSEACTFTNQYDEYYDESGHSRICDVCNGTLWESHTFVSGVCACGYEHDHSYSDYSSNANGHWQECTGCDYVTATAFHSDESYINDGNATSHSVVCSVCNFTFNRQNHNFIYSPYIDNTHAGECQYCRYTKYEAHTVNSYIYEDEMSHTGTCIVCYGEVIENHNPITGGCSVCGWDGNPVG